MIIEDIPIKQLELGRSLRKNVIKFAKLAILSTLVHFASTLMFAYIEQCYEPQTTELTPIEMKYNAICHTLKTHFQINQTSSDSNSTSVDVLANITKTLCQEVKIETLKCDLFSVDSLTRWGSYQGSISYTIGWYPCYCYTSFL